MNTITEALKLLALSFAVLGPVLGVLTWIINNKINKFAVKITTQINELEKTVKGWTQALLDDKYVSRDQHALVEQRVGVLERRIETLSPGG